MNRPLPAILLFAAVIWLIMVVPGLAQTVLFKSPPSAEFICLQNANAQAEKIRELKTIIAQLQARVLLADARVEVRAVKVKKIKRRRRRG